jgi:hypothetical protein
MAIDQRQPVRERLALELSTALGATVYSVYSYMATGFEGKSPVVRVMNGGSLRPRVAGFQRNSPGSKFRYVIQTFVLFDEQATSAEQQAAENELDRLEAVIAQTISDQDQIPGIWKSLTYYDYSEPVLMQISAFHYLVETFGIEVQVDD